MLFMTQPIMVGKIEVHNRLIMAPVMTKMAKNRQITDEVIESYDKRTKGGYFGLVVTEHCSVADNGSTGDNMLSISEDEDIDGLARLAKVIHSNGSRVILQMNHAGSMANEKLIGMKPLAPSPIVNPNTKATGEPHLPKEMTSLEIKLVIRAFVEAAVRSKMAGFDGCEIHSAHGYLLNQFMSPLTNKRNDLYAGRDLSSRIHLHLQIIQAVRAAVGHDFIISMRLGGCDYMDGGSTIEDAVAAAKAFEKVGLNMLNVSGGMCRYDRPGHTGPGYFADQAEAITKSVNIPVVITGGIGKAVEAEALLRSGIADMVGIGRALLKDPEWAKKELG